MLWSILPEMRCGEQGVPFFVTPVRRLLVLNWCKRSAQRNGNNQSVPPPRPTSRPSPRLDEPKTKLARKWPRSERWFQISDWIGDIVVRGNDPKRWSFWLLGVLDCDFLLTCKFASSNQPLFFGGLSLGVGRPTEGHELE